MSSLVTGLQRRVVLAAVKDAVQRFSEAGRDEETALLGRTLPVPAARSGQLMQLDQAQHFLMLAAARTLSLVDLCDLSEDAAHEMLCGMRWPDADGAPICPHCSCAAVYTYRCRRLFKCKACHRQFSATSGTSHAPARRPDRDGSRET